MENKLEFVKYIISKNIKSARCGIFSTRNLVGDEMTTLYRDNDIQIDICYHWEYFEVFGLSENEFEVLAAYYEYLVDEIEGDDE